MRRRVRGSSPSPAVFFSPPQALVALGTSLLLHGLLLWGRSPELEVSRPKASKPLILQWREQAPPRSITPTTKHATSAGLSPWPAPKVPTDDPRGNPQINSQLSSQAASRTASTAWQIAPLDHPSPSPPLAPAAAPVGLAMPSPGALMPRSAARRQTPFSPWQSAPHSPSLKGYQTWLEAQQAGNTALQLIAGQAVITDAVARPSSSTQTSTVPDPLVSP